MKDFKNISLGDVDKIFESFGVVKTIRQTSGPTLLIINDGECDFTFKAFLKAGVRAYSNILESDYIKVKFRVTKRFEGVEGEVINLEKLSDKQILEFEELKKQKSSDLLKEDVSSFSIESEKYDKMKNEFISISKEIKKAIIDNIPIILRHNADCDGYSCAICIERAIKCFYEKISNGDLTNFYLKYKRQPSKAPFYEYEDCFKDLTMWIKEHKRNNEKPPLIIICDNGSTREDLLSIKQMKIYNSKIIVLDHHSPTLKENGESLISDFVDLHLNPYLFGFDSNLCCGMLGFELSRFIFSENKNMFFVPAMSSIIDHTQSEEKEKYIELANKEGFSNTFLEEYGEIIDMFIFYLRFSECRNFVLEIFGDDIQKIKEMYNLFKPELENRYKSFFKLANHFLEKKEFKNFDLILFDGERGTNRGEYPQIGKSTNYLHKTIEKENKKPIITCTYGSCFMTIRCSDNIKNFNVNDFIKILKNEYVYLNCDGGGHEKAGSVKFVGYSKEKTIEVFLDYLESLNLTK